MVRHSRVPAYSFNDEAFPIYDTFLSHKCVSPPASFSSLFSSFLLNLPTIALPPSLLLSLLLSLSLPPSLPPASQAEASSALERVSSLTRQLQQETESHSQAMKVCVCWVLCLIPRPTEVGILGYMSHSQTIRVVVVGVGLMPGCFQTSFPNS